MAGILSVRPDKMSAEGFDLCQGLAGLLRLPVAKVNQRRDRRDVSEGQHGGIVAADQAFVHHSVIHFMKEKSRD